MKIAEKSLNAERYNYTYDVTKFEILKEKLCIKTTSEIVELHEIL